MLGRQQAIELHDRIVVRSGSVVCGWYEPDHDVVIYDSGPLGNRRAKSQNLPKWPRRITGEECFHCGTEIHLPGRRINDEDLIYPRHFDGLRTLNLERSDVTDDGN